MQFGLEIEATPRRNPERTMGSNASCTQEAKEGNKSFIIKGRGSSVVEQPIRNRQAASSTLALGSKICWVQPDLRGREFRRFSKCAVEMITFTIFATF